MDEDLDDDRDDDRDDAMDPAKKAARAAAKKESAGRLKETVKAANAAGARAKASPSIENHRAAEVAHRAAFNEASSHYLNHRGALSVHDLSRAHANEAQFHQGEKVKLEKSENEKKMAEWNAHTATPAYKAAQHVKAAKESEQTAFESKLHGVYRPHIKPDQARSQEAHAARSAIKSYEAAHAIEPDKGHQAAADNVREKHASALKTEGGGGKSGGGGFDESKHPRDENGKFDSSWQRVQRMDLASGEELGERRTTQQGGTIARANLTRTGVLTYVQSDGSVRRELRHPAEVFDPKSLATLANATLTADHPDKVTPKNWRRVAIGHVAGEPHREGKFVQGEIHIQHDAAIEQAGSGKLRELSCGYECSLDPTPGVFEGEPYDAVQRNIRYNHVAAGPAGWGRAGAEVRMHLDGGEAVSDGGGNGDKARRYVRAMPDLDEEKKQLRADAARAETEKVRADTAERELAQLRADHQKSEGELIGLRKLQGQVTAANTAAADQARLDASFDEQLEAFEEARRWLGPKWERKRADGSRKTVGEIRLEVVSKLQPAWKTDGMTDGVVQGMYIAATTSADAAERGRIATQLASNPLFLQDKGFNPFGKKKPDDDDDDDDTKDSANAAQDAMFQKQKDAWKTPKRDRGLRTIPGRTSFNGGNQGSAAGGLGKVGM